MTEQPTEQWVQTFLWLVTVAPGGGGGPASALRIPSRGKVPSAARLPAVRPERRRKLRRSNPPEGRSASAGAARPRLGCRSDLLISTGCALLRRIAVDAIEFLNFGGIRPIPRLALFVDVIRERLDLVDRSDCGQSDASRNGAKQVAAAEGRFPRFVHTDPPTEQFLPWLALNSRSNPR